MVFLLYNCKLEVATLLQNCFCIFLVRGGKIVKCLGWWAMGLRLEHLSFDFSIKTLHFTFSPSCSSWGVCVMCVFGSDQCLDWYRSTDRESHDQITPSSGMICWNRGKSLLQIWTHTHAQTCIIYTRYSIYHTAFSTGQRNNQALMVLSFLTDPALLSI